MAIETYTVQLERVQAAIAAIEDGAQSYSIAGRLYTRGSLDALYKREERLRPKADREARGGIPIKFATPATGR